jgi:steroid delta-isomerase-like uncharacterized protein
MTVDELSDAWLTAWSDGDEDAFHPLCAPSMHYQDPLTPMPLRGAGAVAEHAARVRAGLPDLKLDPAGARPSAERFVAVPWRLQGTFTEPLGDLPPSGRTLALHGLFYCELDGSGPDGAGPRLLRVRAFFDLYDAAVQLGVLPRRGTLSERALLMLRGFGLRVRGA